MQQSASDWDFLRFGVFEADLHTGELTKRGKRLRLQDQPFRLLAVLLENRGSW
jgi:DNA-binding response OmpR family regulator